MSAVILDATENGEEIYGALSAKLRDRGLEYKHHKLEELKILPCRSCGACSIKSPGKCVQKDDMHDIMRDIARGSLIIFITPIRFGGFSSQLKKAVDRTMGVCVPTYIIRDGHFLHPARYGTKTLLGIGIYEDEPGEQVQCFEKLVEHNAVNMQFTWKTLCVKAHGDIEAAGARLDGILGEVAL